MTDPAHATRIARLCRTSGGNCRPSDAELLVTRFASFSDADDAATALRFACRSLARERGPAACEKFKRLWRQALRAGQALPSLPGTLPSAPAAHEEPRP